MTEYAGYALGHSDAELTRLKLQADIIAPVTHRLVRESNIGKGMNVLEIGCGAGDVSMLLADLVGSEGSIYAIDRAEEAVVTARRRASEKGYRNITFAVSGDDGLGDDRSYDAAFGRYVLVHQPDPAAFLRHVANVVKVAGTIAFHELMLTPPLASRAYPDAPLFQAVSDATTHAFHSTVPSPEIASRLVACFEDAGIYDPHVFWESIATDYRSPMLDWVYLNYLAMRAKIDKLGLRFDPENNPETLLQRMKTELAVKRCQIVSPPQVCGWAVVR